MIELSIFQYDPAKASTFYLYFILQGVDPELAAEIDMELEADTVCLWQEKSTYQVLFDEDLI